MNTSGAFGYEEIKRMELREFYTLVQELNIYGSEKSKSSGSDNESESDQITRAMNDPAIRTR